MKDLKKIVQHLNNKNNKELDYNINQFISINNDMKIEKEIYQTVENSRFEIQNNSKYDKLFLSELYYSINYSC